MLVGDMGILQEIVLKEEKGRKEIKVKGKECGRERVARVTPKEKERVIIGEKEIKEKEKEIKGKEKETTGECLRVEKGTKEFVTSVVRKGIRQEKDCAGFRR